MAGCSIDLIAYCWSRGCIFITSATTSALAHATKFKSSRRDSRVVPSRKRQEDHATLANRTGARYRPDAAAALSQPQARERADRERLAHRLVDRHSRLPCDAPSAHGAWPRQPAASAAVYHGRQSHEPSGCAGLGVAVAVAFARSRLSDCRRRCLLRDADDVRVLGVLSQRAADVAEEVRLPCDAGAARSAARRSVRVRVVSGAGPPPRWGDDAVQGGAGD